MKKLLYLMAFLPSIALADSKVSALNEQLGPKATDYLYIVANATSQKVAVGNLLNSGSTNYLAASASQTFVNSLLHVTSTTFITNTSSTGLASTYLNRSSFSVLQSIIPPVVYSSNSVTYTHISTFNTHASRHQDGGSDEIAVTAGMMNTGTNASDSTFWRGDNTWATPGGSGDAILAASQTWTGSNLFESSSTFDGNIYIATTIYLNNSAGSAGNVLSTMGEGQLPEWTDLTAVFQPLDATLTDLATNPPLDEADTITVGAIAGGSLPTDVICSSCSTAYLGVSSAPARINLANPVTGTLPIGNLTTNASTYLNIPTTGTVHISHNLTSSNTITISTMAVDDLLTVNGSTVPGHSYGYITADTATTSATLGDTPSVLGFDIGANEAWNVRWEGLVTLSGANGMAIAVSAPAGATCGGGGQGGSQSSFAVCGTATGSFISTANNFAIIGATIVNGSTSGRVQLQFSSFAGVTATLKGNQFSMVAHRISN